MIRIHAMIGASCLMALTLVGCGDSLTLTPASGTVTYNGKPIEGASIVFVPEGSAAIGTGTTDAAGKYTISTNGQPGAISGKQQVTVSKMTASAAAMPTDPKPEDMMKMAKSGGMPAPKSEIPTKYAVVQGGLTTEVSADKKVHDFDLKD